MIIKKIRLKTEDGAELFGLLHLPVQETKQIVIAVHGYSSSCFTKRDDIFAEQLTKNNIAYFAFNNRGTEYCVKIRKNINGKQETTLGGSSYEDILESHYDIKAAVDYIHNQGYQQINLLGHSLGCTKILYYYKKIKPTNIKSVTLLSMTDIVGVQHSYHEKRYDHYVDVATQMVENNQENNFMPKDAFIYPISAKTYLRYFRDNEEINIIQYHEEYDFRVLKDIQVPICIRYGTIKETLAQQPQEVVDLLNNKLSECRLDAGIIEGANHSYEGKEETVINEIINFINKRV